MLDNKQGGMDGDIGDDGMGKKGLNDMIPKKKTETYNMNPKCLFDEQVNYKHILQQTYEAELGEYTDFLLILSENLILEGKARLIHNEFTKMPRGQINL